MNATAPIPPTRPDEPHITPLEAALELMRQRDAERSQTVMRLLAPRRPLDAAVERALGREP